MEKVDVEPITQKESSKDAKDEVATTSNPTVSQTTIFAVFTLLVVLMVQSRSFCSLMQCL